MSELSRAVESVLSGGGDIFTSLLTSPLVKFALAAAVLTFVIRLPFVRDGIARMIKK